MNQRSIGLLVAGLLVVTACGGAGGSSPGATTAGSPAGRSPAAPTTGVQSPAAESPAAESPGAGSPAANIPAVVCVGESTTYLDWLNGDFEPEPADPVASPASVAGDLLEQVRDRGTLRISTDSNYEPQSFLESDGSWVGFDIDVGTEIAERIGVDAEFQHQDWEIITAGSWAGRWDISVGSMTVTTPRKEIMSFTEPYYYTPAYMAASTRSGITALDQLPFTVPDDVTPTTLTTDANCIEQIAAGRPEFDLLITSGTVIDTAVAGGQPIVKIGEPIYVEELAVAIDKSGPPHAALLYEINNAIVEMHADGTLTELSEEWFDGEDLTQPPAE